MMTQEAIIKGWVAVDKDSTGRRRVSLFPTKPVRDVLTDVHYWAATRPYYESIRLDSSLFEGLEWEDEPVEAEITIKINKETSTEDNSSLKIAKCGECPFYYGDEKNVRNSFCRYGNGWGWGLSPTEECHFNQSLVILKDLAKITRITW